LSEERGLGQETADFYRREKRTLGKRRKNSLREKYGEEKRGYESRKRKRVVYNSRRCTRSSYHLHKEKGEVRSTWEKKEGEV